MAAQSVHATVHLGAARGPVFTDLAAGSRKPTGRRRGRQHHHDHQARTTPPSPAQARGALERHRRTSRDDDHQEQVDVAHQGAVAEHVDRHPAASSTTAYVPGRVHHQSAVTEACGTEQPEANAVAQHQAEARGCQLHHDYQTAENTDTTTVSHLGYAILGSCRAMCANCPGRDITRNNTSTPNNTTRNTRRSATARRSASMHRLSLANHRKSIDAHRSATCAASAPKNLGRLVFASSPHRRL